MDNRATAQAAPDLMDLFLANLYRYIEPQQQNELGRAQTSAGRLPLLLGGGFKFPVAYDYDNTF